MQYPSTSETIKSRGLGQLAATERETLGAQIVRLGAAFRADPSPANKRALQKARRTYDELIAAENEARSLLNASVLPKGK